MSAIVSGPHDGFGTATLFATVDAVKTAGDAVEQVDPQCLRDEKVIALLAEAPWRRLAVIGDSLAEGLGDPVDGYRDASWAERLALGLRSAVGHVAYLNLGRRGLVTAEILASQLPRAMAFAPDLAVVSAGANDMLRASFDPAAVQAGLEALVGALADAGAVVVTFGLYDLSGTGLVPEGRRDAFRRRTVQLNAVTRAATERHGGVHVDFFGRSPVQDSLLSADLTHPNRRGHARIASEIIRALGGLQPTWAAGTHVPPRSRP